MRVDLPVLSSPTTIQAVSRSACLIGSSIRLSKEMINASHADYMGAEGYLVVMVCVACTFDSPGSSNFS